MLEKSFGLFYFLKQPKTSKRPNHYVYLRITVDSPRLDFSIQRNWPFEENSITSSFMIFAFHLFKNRNHVENCFIKSIKQ